MLVRMSEEEKAEIQAKADTLETSASALMRNLALLPFDVIHTLADHPEGSVPLLVFDRQTYPRLMYQIRKWGYHYDGCLHALNAVAANPRMKNDDMRAYLAEAMDHLRQVDNAREGLEASVNMLLLAPQIQLDPVAGSTGLSAADCSEEGVR